MPGAIAEPGAVKNGAYFNTLLRDHGILLRDGSKTELHKLEADKFEAIKGLSKAFKSDLMYPAKAKEFIQGFTAFLDDNEQLLRSLKPTSSSVADSELQDSVVRILLKIDDIQPDLISWLLEKMVFVAMAEDDDDEMIGKSKEQEDMSLTQLILCHLSRSNHTSRGNEIADKVIDVLQAGPEDLQREVITALPDIVEEPHQSKIAMILRDTMKEKPNLINEILHAITYLSVDKEAMEEVRRSILKILGTTRSEDLPSTIKFLVEDLGKEDTVEVVQSLRENINFARSKVMSQFTQSKSSKKVVKDVDGVVMYIIKMEMLSNAALRDAWVHEIDCAKVPDDLKAIDFMTLLILHHLPTKKKATESLFKNKIRSAVLTENFVAKTFAMHSLVITEYFQDMIEVCNVLCSSNEPVLTSFVGVLYRECFLNLDAYCKQEIIGDLVTKCCLGIPDRSVTIKILSEIAFKFSQEVMPFVYFLDNILAHAQTFTLSDLREVMDILFFLAYCKSTCVNSLRTNLHITLRKQVDSPNRRLFEMGVIGSVMAVKNMSMSCDELDVTMASTQPDVSRSSTEEETAGSILRKAKKLLHSVHAKCKQFEDAGGLFMDELSNVIKHKRVDKRLERWISNVMAEDFTSEYVVDLDEEGKLQENEMDFMPHSAFHNLEEDSTIALNICPLVVKNLIVEKEKRCTKVTRLISHFRLLKICTAAVNDNSLEDIDALLGCPFIMPNKEVTEKFATLSKQEKEVTLSSLFYVFNWLIELINAFATQEDHDLRSKVIKRMKLLLQMRETLALCLKYEPKYTPPKMDYLSNSSNWQPPDTVAKNAKGKGKGKNRKRKSEELEDATQCEKVNNDEHHPVDLNAYAPFFRELDLDAFATLSYDTVQVVDAFHQVEECKLGPNELSFLVSDMHVKLKHSLVASKSKKGFPGKARADSELTFSNLDQLSADEVAKFGISQIDYLLGNMDVFNDLFKRMIDDNGGVVDDSFALNETTATYLQSYSTILFCLKEIVTWNGMTSVNNKELLKEFLLKIGQRANYRAKSDWDLKDLAKAAFDHILTFKDSILNMTCGEILVLLLEALAGIAKGKDRELKLLELCREFLRKEWFDATGKPERGATFNARLETLLKVLLGSDQEFSVKEFDKYVLEEMANLAENLGKRECSSETCKTFNKQTFGLHFKVFLQQLVMSGKSSTLSKCGSHSKVFNNWLSLMQKLSVMMDVCKMGRTRPLIAAVLKFARQFLELFLTSCLPLIDKQFSSKRNECFEILREMQKSTRYLHHVCSYCKESKDLGLSRPVPQLRKVLETIVYKVKAMLVNHSAVDAFQIGTLKNRDLAGEIIHSQAMETEEEEENQDPLPEDDESEVEMEDEAQEDESNDNDESLAV